MELCVLGCYQTYVGCNRMIDYRLALAECRQSKLFGHRMHQYHRSWHTGLVVDGSHNLVFVFYLTLFYRPCHLDSLELQEHLFLIGYTWVNHDVVLVTTVSVSSNVQLIVAFWQLHREDAMLVGLTLSHQCHRSRIAYHYLCTSYMWLFICIVSVFVSNVNMQDAFLLRHRRYGVFHRESLTRITVDAEVSAIGNIQLHALNRYEA